MDGLTVKIPVEEYRQLVEDSKEYETLVNLAIFGGRLDITDHYLVIDEEAVTNFLKTMWPHLWKRREEALKDELKV